MSKFSSREKDNDGNYYTRYYSSADEYYRVKGCYPTPSARSGSNGSDFRILGWIPALLLIWFIGNWVIGSVKNNSIPAEQRVKNYHSHWIKTLTATQKEIAECESFCSPLKKGYNTAQKEYNEFKKLTFDRQSEIADQGCIEGRYYITCVDESKSKKKF
jgi:hypothetical protein